MEVEYVVFLLVVLFCAIAFLGMATHLGMWSKICPRCGGKTLFASRLNSATESVLSLFLRYYRCGDCERRLVKFRFLRIRSAGASAQESYY